MPLTMHSLLSFPLWLLMATCTYCIPLPDFFCPGTQLRCPWQRATRNILKLSNDGDITSKLWIPNWCGHRSLEFAILFNDQNPHTSEARWSEYLSGFNLVIRFHPGKLRTKPDALTRWWTSILKEGIATMPVSIHRTTAQYSLLRNWHHPSELPPNQFQSLWISHHGLWKAPFQHLVSTPDDPIPAEHLYNQSDPKWTLDPDGLLRHLRRIYVPNSSNLWLPVLQYSHDHPLQVISSDKDPSSSPYGNTIVQTSSLHQGLLQIMHHLLLCQTHAPQTYGLSSNFWFPRSLEFHIHGFHREAPSIFQLYLNLVIVDCLSKQSLFIPIHDTITSPQHAQLFILHIFSKHSVQATSLADHVQNLYPTSAGPSELHWTWSFTSLLDIILKWWKNQTN